MDDETMVWTGPVREGPQLALQRQEIILKAVFKGGDIGFAAFTFAGLAVGS
jgi:hypothetical protein